MKTLKVVVCFFIYLLPGILHPESQGRPEKSPLTGTITVEDGKLYYGTAGAGEWIVLLHDGILHQVVWDSCVPYLARNYRVVRYDRRGFGKSSKPRDYFSNIDDLKRLFDQLQIGQAIIFGMSAGGGLAIDFTLQYPDKVTALVLAGAVVSGYGYSRHFLTRGGHISSLTDYLEPEKFIKYFGWEDPYEVYPENTIAKKKFLKLLEENPQNVNGALTRFAKPPERPAVRFLSEIKVPTLILVGEHDIPDVHAHAGVIEAGITQSKREIVPDSGHLIPLEQPEAFNESVGKFLIGLEFYRVLNSRGVGQAVQFFHKMRKIDPGKVFFEEPEMNALGYRYLQSGNVRDAIGLFILNTLAFPNSANVYDSLGEAYLMSGDKENARTNYKKSIELDPNNENAREMLKRIEKE